MIVKNRKISVKSFLNKRLPFKLDNEVLMEDNEKKGPFYPVYIRATYDRKSNQIKSCIDEYVNTIDELSPKSKRQLDEQIRIYKLIIDYEAHVLNNKNPLSVLPSKYKYYSTNVIEEVRDLIMEKYYRILFKTRSEYMRLLYSIIYHKIPFSIFLKATKTLIPDFEYYIDSETKQLFYAYEYINNILLKTGRFGKDKDLTIIDWYSGNSQEWIKSKLITDNNKVPTNHDQYISIIDRIIRE